MSSISAYVYVKVGHALHLGLQKMMQQRYIVYVNCLVTVFMPILDDQQLVLRITASTKKKLNIFLTSRQQSTVLPY